MRLHHLLLGTAAAIAFSATVSAADSDPKEYKPTGNPLFSHKFTADPAPVVIGDTLWMITSHDETAANGGLNRTFRMRDWCIFSTKDMKTWTEYPTPLSVDDFKWDGTHTAYAAQMIPRDGKYYLYISTNGNGIGVAVADKPEGPYKDPIGKQLVKPSDCFATTHSWACIDPTVMIDDDGQAWLVWGNRKCYYAKLKNNMVELDGAVKTLDIDLKDMPFEEGPWIFKHDGRYYLVYACGNPEKLAYAIGDKVDGHFEAKGILMERSGNCGSNHPGVANFNGEWYLFYHTGANGGDYNRAVCVDKMTFNADGTINPVPFSREGIFGTGTATRPQEQGGQRPGGQGMAQGGRRRQGQGGFGQGGQRQGMGQGGFGQGGQRPQGQVRFGQGGQRQGMGQGGPRSSVDTISRMQEKYPDEYKAAQQLRQSDPAAYRAKMRELQQKLNEAQ